MRTRGTRSRHGQAIIFLMMVVVLLFFMVLWNFDLHKILYTKFFCQNAGDSAALIAARWQALTLNLIGDLNIMHAIALQAGNAGAESAITNVQARLCFAGPLIGFMGAQQAAKNNSVYANDDFNRILESHVRTVRQIYRRRTNNLGQMMFPEPYPNAWTEYADMLELIRNDGVAAGADNVQYYTDALAGAHFLLMVDFYEAIAGRSWCWFRRNAPNLLEEYTDYRWWDPLPPIPHAEYINSEIFGLGLAKRETSVLALADFDTVADLATTRGLGALPSSNRLDRNSAWYCYGDRWTRWDKMATDGDNPFPATGPVKSQYDYAGADAAIRIEETTQRLTPLPGGGVTTNGILWTAAAKPFGSLNEDEKPNAYSLVLPAYEDVRLIPMDASSAPAAGGYNLEWRIHVDEHLPQYMEQGLAGLSPSCWYCKQLDRWEDPGFRQTGIDWLAANGYLCDIQRGGGGGGGRGGGGGGRGGGSGRRRGH